MCTRLNRNFRNKTIQMANKVLNIISHSEIQNKLIEVFLYIHRMAKMKMTDNMKCW